MKNERKSPKAILGLSLLVAFGLAGTSYVVNAQQFQQQERPQQQQSQDVIQQRLQGLQVQLQQLNAEISAVQQEANKSPKVRRALKQYSAALTKQMKATVPEKSDVIDERDAIYEQLLEMSTNENRTEEETQKLQSLSQRFNSIRQELSMIEAQANHSDPVQKAFKKYNEKIMAEMSEIEPSIPQKIEQHEKLTQEFTNLRNAIQQQR
jgi:preprotein translocase subunit SecD